MTRLAVVALPLMIAALVGSCAVGVPAARTVDGLRRSADQHVGQRRMKAAEADLRRIFVLDAPKDNAGALLLLQDAHFALGSVLLVTGRFDEALAEADKGLSLGDDQSIFGANLHGLRAMALEAAGKPIDALPDYTRAIEIHKQLFDTALAKHEGGNG